MKRSTLKTPILSNDYLEIKQTKYGPMAYNKNDIYVGGSFRDYGEFSDGEVSFLLSLVNKDSVVLDIGANIGALTVPLAKKVKEVLAFEPQTDVFNILATNVALNCLNNVKLRNCAVGSKESLICIPRPDPRQSNNFGGVELDSAFLWPKKEYVWCSMLDSILHMQESDKKPDLIKIDVEGMELEVLKGAQEYILKYKPILYIENDRKHKSAALISFIKNELQYSRLDEHCPPLYNESNFYKNKENKFSNIVSINLVCYP